MSTQGDDESGRASKRDEIQVSALGQMSRDVYSIDKATKTKSLIDEMQEMYSLLQQIRGTQGENVISGMTQSSVFPKVFTPSRGSIYLHDMILFVPLSSGVRFPVATTDLLWEFFNFFILN